MVPPWVKHAMALTATLRSAAARQQAAPWLRPSPQKSRHADPKPETLNPLLES